MPYSLLLNSLPTVEAPGERVEEEALVCTEAKHGCMPAYVFSVEGQVRFRHALRHLSECRRRSCQDVKRTVIEAASEKLTWLFREAALLGCVHVQPYLYGANDLVFDRAAFSQVAFHLSKCPHDSCAQLRRSLLLRIRDRLRPA